MPYSDYSENEYMCEWFLANEDGTSYLTGVGVPFTSNHTYVVNDCFYREEDTEEYLPIRTVNAVKLGMYIKCHSDFGKYKLKDCEGYIVSIESFDKYFPTDHHDFYRSVIAPSELVGVVFNKPVYDNEGNHIGRVYTINGKKCVVVYVPVSICFYNTAKSVDFSVAQKRGYNKQDFQPYQFITLKSQDELEKIYGYNYFGELNSEVRFPKEYFKYCDKSWEIITIPNTEGIMTVRLIGSENYKRLETKMFKEYIEDNIEDDNSNWIYEIANALNSCSENINTTMFHWFNPDKFATTRANACYNHMRVFNNEEFIVLDNEEDSFTFGCQNVQESLVSSFLTYSEIKNVYKKQYNSLIKQNIFKDEEVIGNLLHSPKWSFLNRDNLIKYRATLERNYNTYNSYYLFTTIKSPLCTTTNPAILHSYFMYHANSATLLNINSNNTLNTFLIFKIKKSAFGVHRLLEDFNMIINN